MTVVGKDSMLEALSLVLERNFLAASDLQQVAVTASSLRKLVLGHAQKKLCRWQIRIKSNDPRDRYLV